MPKIVIEVKSEVSAGSWKEEYDIHDDLDPKLYALGLISRYNKTIRTFESPRTLVSVTVTGKSARHTWSKVNAFTICDRYGTYDRMKCKACGVTGKRFGVSSIINRDSKYLAKKYAQCSGKEIQ